MALLFPGQIFIQERNNCMANKQIIPETDPDILDPEDIVVTIELDNGREQDCEIVTIFTANRQDYIALLPVDSAGEPIASEGVYLYRYFEDEDENPSIGNIEDDAEYKIASDAYNALFS